MSSDKKVEENSQEHVDMVVLILPGEALPKRGLLSNLVQTLL